ncbi:MAG: ATP-binding protein [Pseudomonadota bacterium]
MPDPIQPIVLEAYSSPSRRAVIRDSFPAGSEQSDVVSAAFNRGLGAEYETLEAKQVRFRVLGSSQLTEYRNGPMGSSLAGASALEVSLQIQEGKVLSIIMAPSAIFSFQGPYLVLGVVLCLAITSILALRVIFRPLKELEIAAHKFGTTSKTHLVDLKGTEDVRRVTQALNTMQTRVKSLLAERSRILASLAHDIRTSLTHMKLRLDKMDKSETDSFEGDIDHMERLIGDMLLYAQAEQPLVRPELIELNEFLSDLVSSLPYDDIESDIAEDSFLIAGEPASFHRALSNLISNAKKYASGGLVRSQVTSEGLDIYIEDEGPGIPEAELEHIFDPFYRVEPSRSRDTGGSGLGLTIARALLSAQGATLDLSNRIGGGLCAHIHVASQYRVV